MGSFRSEQIEKVNNQAKDVDSNDYVLGTDLRTNTKNPLNPITVRGALCQAICNLN